MSSELTYRLLYAFFYISLYKVKNYVLKMHVQNQVETCMNPEPNLLINWNLNWIPNSDPFMNRNLKHFPKLVFYESDPPYNHMSNCIHRLARPLVGPLVLINEQPYFVNIPPQIGTQSILMLIQSVAHLRNDHTKKKDWCLI